MTGWPLSPRLACCESDSSLPTLLIAQHLAEQGKWSMSGLARVGLGRVAGELVAAVLRMQRDGGIGSRLNDVAAIRARIASALKPWRISIVVEALLGEWMERELRRHGFNQEDP